MRKTKAAVLISLALLGLAGFFAFGFNATHLGPVRQSNCSDVSGIYEPCELQTMYYGWPVSYAKAYPLIPGTDYSTKLDTNYAAIAVDIAAWVAVLPAACLIVIKLRRRSGK